MDEMITIQGTEIEAKEYNCQRVVTFTDIDRVHQRPRGTARKRFNDNRRRFIDGVDFYRLNKEQCQLSEIRTVENVSNNGITLITESGYLMLVKSFTDDLAWSVQRELVNCYFRGKRVATLVSRPLTTDDYMEAARTVSKCCNSRLPIVLDLYKKAGFDVLKIEQVKPSTDDTWEQVKEILSYYTLREAAALVDIPRTSLCGYRNGTRRPSASRCAIIIKKLGGDY